MEYHPVTPAVKASPIKDMSRSPGKLYQHTSAATKIENMGHDYRDDHLEEE